MGSLRETRLTWTEAAELHANWSPDGRTIAFDSNRSGSMDLYLMAADGSNVRQLTDTPDVPELVPVWSPDGARIAFNREVDGAFDIFVMNADGSGQVNLTRHPATDIVRGWSPDGRHLPFNSDRSGNHEIYAMADDGSGVRRLTFDTADDRIALWAPDGGEILFARSGPGLGGGRALFAVPVTGGTVRMVFDSAGEDFYPQWASAGPRMAIVIRNASGSDIYELDRARQSVRKLSCARHSKPPGSAYNSANDPPER